MATEKRLIDANALKKYINENHSYSGLPMAAHICTIELLEYAPTIDAVEVVHGRWKEVTDQNESFGEMDVYQCSVCGKLRWFETNYCPNCGAKMDGDGNG